MNEGREGQSSLRMRRPDARGIAVRSSLIYITHDYKSQLEVSL